MDAAATHRAHIANWELLCLMVEDFHVHSELAMLITAKSVEVTALAQEQGVGFSRSNIDDLLREELRHIMGLSHNSFRVFQAELSILV